MVTLNFEGEKHELTTEAAEQGASEFSALLSFEDCLAVLTSKEGDSVTILAQNPDAEHITEQFAIDVNGEWTDWRDARHLGDTQLAALKKAARFKRILER